MDHLDRTSERNSRSAAERVVFRTVNLTGLWKQAKPGCQVQICSLFVT